MRTPMRVLSRADLATIMTRNDYLEVVEQGFRALRKEKHSNPPPLHIPCDGGGFHAKAARYEGARDYVALKLNGNFPGNPSAHGLPTIQGVLLLCDARLGTPLAIMDSIEVTLRRTAAASALAAKHLAAPDSSTLAICGCGDQASSHLQALADLFPIKRVALWDIDPERARKLAAASFGDIELRAAGSLEDATRSADIVVTCTTSSRPFLDQAHVRPGAFVAAVGADSANKSEIAPSLLARARVVVDLLRQCNRMGDLHHGLAAGTMSEADVHTELAELVTGEKPGRTDAQDIFIFDSTGVAIQDAATAARAFERAEARGAGALIELGGMP